MANIKSAKKRAKVIAKKTANNRVRKSIVKTAEKKFMEAIEAGDKELAIERLKIAEKAIDKAAAKNVIHKNAAARKVSRLAKKLNA
ncbi:MAG: 30S ribosomal protein S20 [Clostridia bacterium]|nr:30S ribosomal protein S20 [Clostridia bacterium]